MSKWLIGIGVSLVSAALGVAAAYGGIAVLNAGRLQNAEAVQSVRDTGDWDVCRERMEDGGWTDKFRDRRRMFQDWRSGIEDGER
jgi:hypothetical protein